MQAVACEDKVQIKSVEKFCNITCLCVDCLDYAAYKRLPSLVSFESETFGLTGWNSDTHYAYYRNDIRWASEHK